MRERSTHSPSSITPNSPSRPDRSAQSHQSQESQKPQLAHDSNGVTSVTARSPVYLFWNFKATRRFRADNFTDVICLARFSCLDKVAFAGPLPHYARPCERGRCPCSPWDDRRGCCLPADEANDLGPHLELGDQGRSACVVHLGAPADQLRDDPGVRLRAAGWDRSYDRRAG